MKRLDSGEVTPAASPERDKGDPLLMSHDFDEQREDERDARAHFPNLAAHVVPRESDEYPTHWSGQ